MAVNAKAGRGALNWDVEFTGGTSMEIDMGEAYEMEELIGGNTLRVAIKNGFKRATPAILDGNVTTLIAAVVLYFMGSGTVKGFAATLTIGIVLSMFTALFVTRLIVNSMMQAGIHNPKYYGLRLK